MVFVREASATEVNVSRALRTKWMVLATLGIAACSEGQLPTVDLSDGATSEGGADGALDGGADASDDTTADAVTDGTSDGGDVAGDGAGCRSDDDCNCARSEVCRMGQCVAMPGAMLCTDPVACTDDRCNMTTGRCEHEPNDMRCPSGQFCDRSPTGGGCVRELPCELGDSTCSRLQGDACNGTWSCDPARLRCVRSAPFNCDDMDMCTMDTCTTMGTVPMCQHMGPDYTTDVTNCGRCGARCPAAAHQTASCAMGACGVSCESGWVDLNGMPADGCECNAMSSDAPESTFADSNCDGIDGTVSAAIFVSPRGDDANDGLGMVMPGPDGRPRLTVRPKRTLAAAVTAAAEARPPKSVYAALGTYVGSVRLSSGVSIYGGYNDADNWSRAATNVTTVDGDTTTGVLGQNLTGDLELQLLTITSRDAASMGDSSYGVRIIASSARV